MHWDRAGIGTVVMSADGAEGDNGSNMASGRGATWNWIWGIPSDDILNSDLERGR